RILACLEECGYAEAHRVLCAADYGVPQTRDRLILVASRVDRPRLPQPTHAENPAPPDLWGESLLPWVGWYEAVEDILHTLPTAKKRGCEGCEEGWCPGHFADWQLA